MGKQCCDHAAVGFDGLSAPFRRTLWAVIAINSLMFAVELSAGVAARSQALQADALDFLGDSFTYSLTLLVLGRPLRWRATAALVKGATLALLGAAVLGATIYRVFVLGQPDEVVMGTVGAAAFAANVTCALLLMRFRQGDANVRSVWLCSRNDAIGNLAVIVAAVLVLVTTSPWPDLAVAGAMAALFLSSAVSIIRQALAELESTRTVATAQPERASN